MRVVKSIYKISDLFGQIKNSSDESIYPPDYQPGKKYGREILSKIFSKLTGFPYLAVREAYFPLLPGGAEPEYDPKEMQVYGPEPITIVQFANKEKEKYKSWNLEKVELSWDNLSDDFKKHCEESNARTQSFMSQIGNIRHSGEDNRRFSEENRDMINSMPNIKVSIFNTLTSKTFWKYTIYILVIVCLITGILNFDEMKEFISHIG